MHRQREQNVDLMRIRRLLKFVQILSPRGTLESFAAKHNRIQSKERFDRRGTKLVMKIQELEKLQTLTQTLGPTLHRFGVLPGKDQ